MREVPVSAVHFGLIVISELSAPVLSKQLSFDDPVSVCFFESLLREVLIDWLILLSACIRAHILGADLRRVLERREMASCVTLARAVAQSLVAASGSHVSSAPGAATAAPIRGLRSSPFSLASFACRLPNGPLLEVARGYPIDAVLDTPEAVPEDVSYRHCQPLGYVY